MTFFHLGFLHFHSHHCTLPFLLPHSFFFISCILYCLAAKANRFQSVLLLLLQTCTHTHRHCKNQDHTHLPPFCLLLSSLWKWPWRPKDRWDDTRDRTFFWAFQRWQLTSVKITGRIRLLQAPAQHNSITTTTAIPRLAWKYLGIKL